MNVQSTATGDGPGMKEKASAATSTAKDSATTVAGEAKQQFGSLMDRTKTEVRQEASKRSEGIAQSMRRLSGQLDALAAGRTDEVGQLGRYVTDARGRVQQLADRLQHGGPDAVMNDVARFARRRPGAFLLAAGTAGFVIGRAVRASSSPPTLGDQPSAPEFEEPPTTPMLVSPAAMAVR